MRSYFKLYNLAIIIYLVTFCWAQNLSFKDIAAQGSLNFIHDHGGSGEYYYVESMGSGVCIFDYDNDGFQEVYWKTNDNTAYLRALMHADGNIRYANYQNEAQMRDYLTNNGLSDSITEIIS